MNEAIKNDNGKPKLSRIPVAALNEIAYVLEFGAAKYTWGNYLNGMDHSRLLDACLRHVFAYANGEDMDKESGRIHLAHAACNLVMLMDCLSNNKGRDDRRGKDE